MAVDVDLVVPRYVIVTSASVTVPPDGVIVEGVTLKPSADPSFIDTEMSSVKLEPEIVKDPDGFVENDTELLLTAKEGSFSPFCTKNGTFYSLVTY